MGGYRRDRATFIRSGPALMQSAESRVYPASRSTPCPAARLLPGRLIRRSASSRAPLARPPGTPSGSLRWKHAASQTVQGLDVTGKHHSSRNRFSSLHSIKHATSSWAHSREARSTAIT